jgi:hypothetical protein
MQPTIHCNVNLDMEAMNIRLFLLMYCGLHFLYPVGDFYTFTLKSQVLAYCQVFRVQKPTSLMPSSLFVFLGAQFLCHKKD